MALKRISFQILILKKLQRSASYSLVDKIFEIVLLLSTILHIFCKIQQITGNTLHHSHVGGHGDKKSNSKSLRINVPNQSPEIGFELCDTVRAARVKMEGNSSGIITKWWLANLKRKNPYSYFIRFTIAQHFSGCINF